MVDNSWSNWNTKAILVLLAYAAMGVYFLILYGFLPLVSWLIDRSKGLLLKWRGKKKMDNVCANRTNAASEICKIVAKNNSTPLQSCLWKQFSFVVISTIIHCTICIGRVLLLGDHDLVLNGTALASHSFIIFPIFLVVYALYLCFGCLSFEKGVYNDKTEIDEKKATDDIIVIIDMDIIYYKQAICQMVVSLVLPIFPLLVSGKWVYFSSLLTGEGQRKAIHYAQFQQHDNNWEQYFSKEQEGVNEQMEEDYHCSLVTMMLKNDIDCIFNIFIPFYAVIFALHFIKMKDECLDNRIKKAL